MSWDTVKVMPTCVQSQNACNKCRSIDTCINSRREVTARSKWQQLSSRCSVSLCPCEPVWPSGTRGTSVQICFSSPFSSKVVVCGHCLVTLSLTINEMFKWLSSLPILMQESFWWWQHSDRYIISLFPPTSIPPSLFLPVPNKPHGFHGR